MKKIRQGQTRWRVCNYTEDGVEGVGAFACFVTNVIQGCIVFKMEEQGTYFCNVTNFRTLHTTFRKALREAKAQHAILNNS